MNLLACILFFTISNFAFVPIYWPGGKTDELEKDFGVGSYISELVALGPNNYTYKVFSQKESAKL